MACNSLTKCIVGKWICFAWIQAWKFWWDDYSGRTTIFIPYSAKLTFAPGIIPTVIAWNTAVGVVGYSLIAKACQLVARVGEWGRSGCTRGISGSISVTLYAGYVSNSIILVLVGFVKLFVISETALQPKKECRLSDTLKMVMHWRSIQIVLCFLLF